MGLCSLPGVNIVGKVEIVTDRRYYPPKSEEFGPFYTADDFSLDEERILRKEIQDFEDYNFGGLN